MGFYIFEPDGFIVRLAFLSFSDFLSFNLWFPHSFLILISTKHYKLHMLHQIWLLSQKINKFCFVLCIIWIYFSRRTRKIRTQKNTHSFLWCARRNFPFSRGSNDKSHRVAAAIVTTNTVTIYCRIWS